MLTSWNELISKNVTTSKYEVAVIFFITLSNPFPDKIVKDFFKKNHLNEYMSQIMWLLMELFEPLTRGIGKERGSPQNK